MNTNAQIQLHFPRPGDWAHFTLTALWLDAEGYKCRRAYRPAELPEGCLPVLQGAVAALVALQEPWQATHVAAVLHAPTPSEGGEDGAEVAESVEVAESAESATESAQAEAVRLSITARRADGARRNFTCADYPQLQLSDAAVIGAFRQLTGGETGSEA